jgi:hypothetical protein
MTLTEYLFLVPIIALALAGAAVWYAGHSARRLEDKFRGRPPAE